jgi:hypothetical protein
MKTNAKIQSITKIAGGKYSIAVSQMIVKENANLLAMLNASDERFAKSAPKATLAWISGEAKDIMNILGIDVTKFTYTLNDKKKEVAVLGIDAPKVGDEDINIQIVESVGPYIKKDGTFDAINNRKKVMVGEGETAIANYFVKDGALVYRYVSVVLGKPKNVKIDDATLIPCDEYELNLELANSANDELA